MQRVHYRDAVCQNVIYAVMDYYGSPPCSGASQEETGNDALTTDISSEQAISVTRPLAISAESSIAEGSPPAKKKRAVEEPAMKDDSVRQGGGGIRSLAYTALNL